MEPLPAAVRTVTTIMPPGYWTTFNKRRYPSSMGARRFVSPDAGETLAGVAARVLPGTENAEQQLLSWNLHLAARAGLGRSVGLLPSDIVFTEPPPAT